jgi:hypothetical protein
MTLAAVFLHGFGVRYDLPIPLPLYLGAAAAVVVLSFVVVAIFASDKLGSAATHYPRAELGFLRGLPRWTWLRALCGLYGTLFLLAIVVTGFWGPQSPERNPAEYLLWIYFWAGMVVLNGLIGPIWDAVNPFTALDSFIRLLTRRSEAPAGPDRLAGLGYWPAVALYFCFADFELSSGYSNRPWLVATLALLYTAFTLAGMQVCGRRSWLEHCEFFTILFSIIRRFAPIQIAEDRVYLRPWGTGLLEPWPGGWDRVTFVILTLSTLAFDGIQATPLWVSGVVAALAPPINAAVGPAWGHFLLFTFGQLDVTVLFLIVFTAFMRAVVSLGGPGLDVVQTISAFALTLIPIAFVYNLAHNYQYLTIQGQGLFPLLADPLGHGWRLLPTAGYQPSWVLAGAATVWYAQVVLIVVGHVIAVYLSHLRAGERFESPSRVLVSQYPMLLLMVMYTACSLWILAQPIAE